MDVVKSAFNPSRCVLNVLPSGGASGVIVDSFLANVLRLKILDVHY